MQDYENDGDAQASLLTPFVDEELLQHNQDNFKLFSDTTRDYAALSVQFKHVKCKCKVVYCKCCTVLTCYV